MDNDTNFEALVSIFIGSAFLSLEIITPVSHQTHLCHVSLLDAIMAVYSHFVYAFHI